MIQFVNWAVCYLMRWEGPYRIGTASIKAPKQFVFFRDLNVI